MDDHSEVLLSCKDVCKNFGATRALIHVDFELRQGEVCGLIGENGSGKSTLTSIFAGVQPQTSGELFRAGRPYRPANMVEAQKAGVAMIVQEAATLPTIDVASNIFIGNYELFSKNGHLDVKKMHREADKILKEIGVEDIKGSTLLAELNFEDRKIIEIARAMYLKPEILVIDESTTALAQKGRQLIYHLIDQMRSEKKGVIFISHDLEELEEVCNKITCLRDGVLVGHLEGTDITTANMRPLMVGRELEGSYYREDWDGSSSDEVVLDIRHITSENGYVQNLSIQLHKGEILGFGGLAGCGMHEVGRMIFGLDKTVTGEVVHVPSGTKITRIDDSIRHNIGYVSKDRDNESIILNASIQNNTVMASYKKLSRRGFISPKAEKRLSDRQIETMRTKCLSGKQFCNQLSGGNKQKVAFSKWLAAGSEIYILDCPTRGIDIGVKAAMYQLIYQFKMEGKAIIMISEELPELIGMSDRMIIMKEGRITGEVTRSKEVTDTKLIEYMV
ncbi:sugar ABC transporter ATP-binding protein [Diplocloster modestus]|uniref:Sugar ABC transporter ATP-binding protein n=1 Tax=Diplocloster modestus TaxID=2850322 RepID=A0ABS6K6R9_9FIRM|nr:sugar ABC transporter ATP-binding protein [Diplocloster modestus]MBU9726197.1 sugar ABC transporter ATP-binding protein [Diplocloster modestus]